jgi:hypothetical protein
MHAEQLAVRHGWNLGMSDEILHEGISLAYLRPPSNSVDGLSKRANIAYEEQTGNRASDPIEM